MKIIFSGGFWMSVLLMCFVFGFTLPINTLAATTPSLGTASSYAIVSSTYTNTVIGTTINGDIGFTTPPAITPAGVHTNYGSTAPYVTAGSDQGAALAALNLQPCTFTFAPGAIDLATDTTHGPIGVYTGGVYCTAGAGAASIGTAGITLSGAGTFIFRINGALTSVVGSSVTLTNGASACDVFWTPNAATTLAATTTFVGTIIDDAGITVGASTTWLGIALAFGGTVTTDTDTITTPSCTTISTGTLHIIKLVVNTHGGTGVSSGFSISVQSGGVNVLGSPANGTGAPGTVYILNSGTYVVSEGVHTGYTQSFSGDCNASGSVILTGGMDKTCTIVNSDIAPIIIPIIPPVVILTGGFGAGIYNSISLPQISIPTNTIAFVLSGPIFYDTIIISSGSHIIPLPAIVSTPPELPHTGVFTNTDNTPWSIVIIVSILIITLLAGVIVLKKSQIKNI